MVIRVTLNQTGTTWRVKLVNCISSQVFDIDDVNDTVSIIFTKTDGTTFSKDADLVEDTENLGEFFIEYRNLGSEISILDLLGHWTYQGAGPLFDDGSDFRTSERTVFWVVP